MATEVKLPAEAEGVEDVTINRWLVKAGQPVKKGEPLLEVATEKVDTVIESPADGTLLQINFDEGELVAVNAVLGLIGALGEAGVQPLVRSPEEPAQTQPKGSEDGLIVPGEELKVTPVARRVAQEESVPLGGVKGSGAGGQVTKDDVLAYVAQRKESPEEQPNAAIPVVAAEFTEMSTLSVRRLAAEHNINLRELAHGRPLGALTREDVLAAIASKETGSSVIVKPRRLPEWTKEQATAQPASQGAARAAAAPVDTQPAGKAEIKPGEELIPHTRMRSLVARHTVQAAFSIPHVTTWWDVTMTAVVEHRKAHKDEFAAAGVNLTFTAYFVQAAVAALKAVPAANSAWSDEGVILKRYYNVGVAVALPADKNGMGGLIVPVIKNAGDLSLMGLARAVNDLAQRARNNALKADELQGGTFTLTNYGTSGSRFQTPVIAGSEAGILGVGAMEKRPVIVSRGHPLEANTGDYLAFLPMVTLGFSYDHRILDGATADAFCAAAKETLENWQ